MKIAILGTGMVGRTIAKRLSQLGHEVRLGTRNVNNTLSSGQQDAYGNPAFKEWYKENSIIGLASFSDASTSAELIFNCTSGHDSLSALKQAGEENLNGKVLIDVANPLDFSNGMPPSLNPVNITSLGEQIQQNFPKAKVVKSLNTMNAGLMVNPSKVQGEHNVFICGDDEQAKIKTKEILNEFGWNNNQIIDLGGISNARGTEMLLPIWLRLWSALGTAEFNFHIQRN